MTEQSETNFYDPHHPHEPEIAPVFDAEGRCLVCGCQWRDQEIAKRDAVIEQSIEHLRRHDPECSLLPENTEEDEGWEREAHGHPEWVAEDDDFVPPAPLELAGDPYGRPLIRDGGRDS